MSRRAILLLIAIVSVSLSQTFAAGFAISSFDRNGTLTWTNVFTAGVCTVEAAPRATGPWQPQQNYFTTGFVGQGSATLLTSNGFFRLLTVDVSTNTPAGYTNFLQSYGTLRTIAGNGLGGTDGVKCWQAGFEGAFATNAALSRPHVAMADDLGNVFIVDKDSHSVLKVTPDGRIHTVAGTHAAGNGPDYATNGTQVQLNAPNGIWVRGGGTAYVLDTGNSKIRRLDTNGMMATLFAVTNEAIAVGRGIWVPLARK